MSAEDFPLLDNNLFQVPAGLIGTFGVVKPWPKIQAAEDENIARLKNTAKQLGLSCIEITPEGEIIGSDGSQVSSSNCDFVINLHFDKPKNYDVFSFVALWNPLKFYLDWGYERVSRHLLSHDDFLSCNSTWADDHVRRMIANRATHLEPEFRLYHSLSHPVFPPIQRQYSLFYAGINWERLGRGKSRHQELLDLLDASGKLRIYGPDIFQGVKVWEGYRSYCKPIPFDGVSMVQEIAQCGAALVLSSEAHKQSELMSNRLFESLAAGALVICDENAFARRHFGDSLLYIDGRVDAKDQFEAVTRHLRWAEDNPAAAVDLATASQRKFLENFRLDQSLVSIYRGFAERKAKIRESRFARPEFDTGVRVICVVDQFDKADLEIRMASLACQTFTNFKVSIVAQKHIIKKVEDVISATRALKQQYDFISLDAIDHEITKESRRSLGSVIQHCLKGDIDEDYILILPPNERIMSNHLEVLIGSAARNPDKSIYATASILCHRSDGEEFFDYCERIEFTQASMQLVGFSRFLLRKSKIRPNISCALPYLDELAIGAFIQDDIFVESLATSVRDISKAADNTSLYSYIQQYSVLSEYSPWLFARDNVTGYSIPAPPPKDEELRPHSMSFNDLTNDNRIELFASLLDSTLPSYVTKPLFWLYDQLTGRGRHPS